MQLLTPGANLIIPILVIGQIILLIAAWITILVSKSIQPPNKFYWILITLFLPVIGPFIFLITFAREARVKS